MLCFLVVIINSYYARKEQDEAKKGGKEYNVLVSLEEFVNCSEKATFIEYNYNKFRNRSSNGIFFQSHYSFDDSYNQSNFI